MVGTEQLKQRYDLVERIAVGGMGTVYKATDRRLDRQVAVKLLKPELAQDPSFVERFRREARAAAALSHPNIATVYDYGEDEGRHFIVMEYVEGRDLAQVLREDGPLPLDRTIAIAGQTCDALTHAHSAGVVHRDVKPANIILSDGDRVKVTDFGIARATGDSTLTATGTMMGTANYMSPEQARGETITSAADLYSLGIVLYEMLTGTVPFVGDTPVSIALRHISEEVPAPSSLNREVPPELDAAVASATAKVPRERYRDAAAMGSAIRLALPTAALPDPDVTASTAPEPGGTTAVYPIPGNRWDPQRLGRTVLIVLGALAAIAAGLLAWRLTSDGETQPGGGGVVPGRATPRATVPAPGFDMPPLVGLSYEDAYQALVNLGKDEYDIDVDPFTVDPVEFAGVFAEEGIVLATDPTADERLLPGTTVTVWVSSGEGDEDEDGSPGKSKGHGKGNGKDED